VALDVHLCHVLLCQSNKARKLLLATLTSSFDLYSFSENSEVSVSRLHVSLLPRNLKQVGQFVEVRGYLTVSDRL
jgi:hypothetical protein